MEAHQFKGTEANVRRALERAFQASAPGTDVWRGAVGPGGAHVHVDVVPFDDDQPAVIVAADVAVSGPLTAGVAISIALENDALLFGRFRHERNEVVVEQAVLGGGTMDSQEVRVAVWSVGWAAAAFAGRMERRLAGDRSPHPLPVPHVEPRRGAEARVESTRERTERFLRERYGSFDHDPNWGYHGGFGSARVFCNVRHYLENSTAVSVAAPVLSDIDLGDELAIDVLGVASRGLLGRFSYVAERRELWFEHAILGDDLDPDELAAAIDGVAAVADAEDDRLQRAYGGRRYLDLLG